jgi:protein dpy-30
MFIDESVLYVHALLSRMGFFSSKNLQAKLAEKAAMEAQEKIDSQALPIRAYLDQTVVPLLLQGLSDLVKAR